MAQDQLKGPIIIFQKFPQKLNSIGILELLAVLLILLILNVPYYVASNMNGIKVFHSVKICFVKVYFRSSRDDLMLYLYSILVNSA